MIPYEKFLECHLAYLEKFEQASRDLESKKENLYKSLDSLISHPETRKAFKTHLLEVRRNL